MRAEQGERGVRGRRGFLLLVILGVLAVLLAVCIGFLSYTRAEVNAVATLRDKNDGADVMQSALDWMAANIAQDLFDGAGKMDPSKPISSARGVHWWYRPHEKGLRNAFAAWPKWANTRPNTVDAAGLDEAVWVYLPEDFFPEGGVRGRFMIQVIDPNGFVNLNDWNEDCNPTQCQMAHMLMDGYGEQELERYRKYRDSNNFTHTPKYAPIRYHEAWRAVTRTVRYAHWPWGNAGDNPSYGESIGMMCSPNWLTTNSSYFSLFGAEMASLKTSVVSDGIPLPGWLPTAPIGPRNYFPPFPKAPKSNLGDFRDASNYGPGLYSYDKNETTNYGQQYVGHMPFGMPFVARAHVDPDTGRSPVNVNTCYNSGDKLPNGFLGGTPCYTLEAVFNVESLRRIINVRSFVYKDSANVDQTASGMPGDANFIETIVTSADKQLAWQKHEELRTKLACQYQETLCRYFTGTYNHAWSAPDQRKYPPLNPLPNNNSGFPTIGAANFDYTGTRFPMSLSAFRTKVRNDLGTMAGANLPTVAFDAFDAPSIPKGQLDARTANAVYDNIVPGPASLPGAISPLPELHNHGLGRDELRPNNTELSDRTKAKSFANVFGYWDDNDTLRDVGYRDVSGTSLHLRAKGLDIADSTAPDGPYDKLAAGSKVPYRQLAFGPDWFSTELTTTTTTFVFIVNAQLVEAKSVAEDPNKPRDVYWGQWGVCVELAPDIEHEGNASDYYKNGMSKPSPGYYKTQTGAANPDSMDCNSSTVKYTLHSGTVYNDSPSAPAPYSNRSSVPKQWLADLRGIRPQDAGAFYTATNQSKKRVIVRAIWNLNQLANR